MATIYDITTLSTPQEQTRRVCHGSHCSSTCVCAKVASTATVDNLPSSKHTIPSLRDFGIFKANKNLLKNKNMHELGAKQNKNENNNKPFWQKFNEGADVEGLSHANNSSGIYAELMEGLDDTLLNQIHERVAYLERMPDFTKFLGRYDSIIKFVEGSILSIYQFTRCKNAADAVVVALQFVGHCTNASMSLNIIKNIKYLVNLLYTDIATNDSKLRFESGSNVGYDVLSWAKIITGEYETFKNTKFVQNLKKLLNYMLSFSVLNFMGIDFDYLGYTTYEKQITLRDFKLGPDLLFTVVSLVIDCVDKAILVYKTGDVHYLFLNNGILSNWVREATSCSESFTEYERGNLPAERVFQLRCDIIRLIEEGRNLLRYGGELSSYERSSVGMRLNDLLTIQKKDLTIMSAMRQRKSPFSVLISGSSSIGKSTLLELMYQHYGKIFDLNISDEFKYTRNAASDFWDNFRSYQWCVVLDDVAYLKPGATGQVDPTLNEIIRVVNNIPYVVDQASLEDKGRTPMLAKLVLASTNIPNMNVDSYFSCPLATLRRMPFMVDVQVKPSYSNGGFLDSSKIDPLQEGEYPDFWHFTIYKVVPDPLDSDRGIHEEVCFFDNIYDYLAWFSEQAKAHDAIQDRLIQSKTDTSKIEVCKKCFRPNYHCVCTYEEKFELQGFRSSQELLDAGIICSPYCDHACGDHCIAQYQRYIERTAAEAEKVLLNSGDDIRFHGKQSLCNKVYWVVLNTLVSFMLFSCSFVSNMLKQLFQLFEFCYACMITTKTPMKLKVCGSLWKLPPWLEKYALKYADYKLRSRLDDVDGKARDFKSFCRNNFVIGLLALLSGTLAVGLTMYFVKRAKSRTEKDRAEEELLQECDDLDIDAISDGDKVEPYGAVSTTARAPVSDGFEKPNVWYDDTFQLSDCDYSLSAASLAGQDSAKFRSKILRNCVQIIFDLGERTGFNKAFCIGGNLYVTNYHTVHALPEKCLMTITDTNSNPAISTFRNLIFRKSLCIMRPDLDLVFFEMKEIPPKKNLIELFVKTTFKAVLKCNTLGVDEKGELIEFISHNVRLQEMDIEMPSNIKKLTCWTGATRTPSKFGDCGSVCYTELPAGKFILGIHCAGNGKDKTCAAPIYRETIDWAIQLLETKVFSPSCPSISSVSAQHRLVGLHPKAPIRFIAEPGCAKVYGSIEGFRPKMKSRVVPSLLAPLVLDLGYVPTKGKPTMTGWVPKRTALLPMVTLPTHIDPVIVKMSCDAFYNDIESKLPESEWALIHVLDMDSAISGVSGIEYLERMKLSTSTGWPWKKPKRKMCTIELKDDNTERVVFCPEIMDRVAKIEEGYKKHELSGIIYDACLKDEPISFKKIKEGKVRVFCGAPVDYCIVVRKYFLNMVRVIQRNKFIFECGPGMVVQSLEWEELCAYLGQNPFNRTIAGDYKNFDKSMPSQIIMAAFDVLIKLSRKAGYTEDDIRVCEGVKNDTSFPLINFFGELIQFYGSNPSGHPLTVIVNGLANSIYMRYCYILLNPKSEAVSFQENVKLMTYGDDNIMTVKEGCDWFNHTSISACLAAVGVVYTMADKEAESVPYIHLRDSSFLKRKFRYDEDVGAVIAPIEHESIVKQFTVYVRSKSICEEAQAMAIMASGLSEYFYYGKAIHAEAIKIFKLITNDDRFRDYIDPNTFLSFDEHRERFWASSEKIKPKWSLTIDQKRELNPKLFADSDPCILRTHISQK